MPETGELDKSNYLTKENIGKIVKEGIMSYQKSTQLGRKTDDVRVKKIYKTKIKKEKGGSK